MVYVARYLEWNCELKTRLSDIVSHLRNDCRQTVTQQLQKSFSTMPTACKFSEMPLLIYLSLRLLRSLFKKFENKCTNKHEDTCTTDLDLAYLLMQWQFWPWLSNGFLERALRVKPNNIIAVFFFSYFIQLCDSRKIHYLTREFRVKLHWKTDIALIASRFVRYRFSRAI